MDDMNLHFVSQLRAEGDPFLRKLEGRFVVSVLHRETGTLRIITNKFGATPCFRTENRYGIAIGNRIAPLIEPVGGKCTPNRAAMARMFAMR
jgi:hypothetical protein